MWLPGPGLWEGEACPLQSQYKTKCWAFSTCTLYGNSCFLRIGVLWEITSFQYSVVELLSFLQGLLHKSKAFSTIKVYSAAISACHVGFGDKHVGQHPQSWKGAHSKRPVFRYLVPLWDLLGAGCSLLISPLNPGGCECEVSLFSKHFFGGVVHSSLMFAIWPRLHWSVLAP